MKDYGPILEEAASWVHIQMLQGSEVSTIEYVSRFQPEQQPVVQQYLGEVQRIHNNIYHPIPGEATTANIGAAGVGLSCSAMAGGLIGYVLGGESAHEYAGWGATVGVIWEMFSGKATTDTINFFRPKRFDRAVAQLAKKTSKLLESLVRL